MGNMGFGVMLHYLMADDVTLLPLGGEGKALQASFEAYRDAVHARIADLEAQLADARDCIDLFNRIIVRAECAWKEQHPDSAFYPDVPDLILWLKEQVDKLAERRCETCKQYLSGYWCMTHRYSPNVNASCSDWQGEET